jgi:hypothetical protein
MSNCHKLFVNGSLFCITHTWARAKSIAIMMDGLEPIDYYIISDFVENVGF